MNPAARLVAMVAGGANGEPGWVVLVRRVSVSIMRRHAVMHRQLLIWSLVLALSAAFAVPAIAFAAGPTIVGPVHETSTTKLAKCDGFTIIVESDFEFTLRLFFDEDGNLDRIEETVSGTDTFVNSKTGKAIAAPFHNTAHLNFEAGTGAFAGVIFKVTVPGAGAIFLDVGRLVLDLESDELTFKAGPHQFFDGDLDALCAALAGEP
jgi:hypothetical protein